MRSSRLVFPWSTWPKTVTAGEYGNVSSKAAPDVAATALGATACYCFWCWLREGDWHLAIICSLLLGFVQLTKMTWVILYAL